MKTVVMPYSNINIKHKFINTQVKLFNEYLREVEILTLSLE